MALPTQIKNTLDSLYNQLIAGEELMVFTKLKIGNQNYKLKVYKEPHPMVPVDVKYRIDILERN